ncbi:hypothetical protein J421_0880 [Gemmatirosa kalamazoonensis]|uniref:Uncharacterized protein n=1 Tax=Gemmatirosa kalamazoonensis TaxID=861299 RepID=W0RD98_9BACT|nr:hypothetical protein J421_0880 [Gemmatirosa kalamazoonensis]
MAPRRGPPPARRRGAPERWESRFRPHGRPLRRSTADHGIAGNCQLRCCFPPTFTCQTAVVPPCDALKRNAPHLADGAGGARVVAPDPVTEDDALPRAASGRNTCPSSISRATQTSLVAHPRMAVVRHDDRRPSRTHGSPRRAERRGRDRARPDDAGGTRSGEWELRCERGHLVRRMRSRVIALKRESRASDGLPDATCVASGDPLGRRMHVGQKDREHRDATPRARSVQAPVSPVKQGARAVRRPSRGRHTPGAL